VATELRDVLWLIELVLDSGAEPIVVGGWGIDALAARQTRSHRDLDVLVPNEFVGPITNQLLGAGFMVTTDWLPVRVELSDVEDDRHIDIHPIFDDGQGCWWQYGMDDTRFEYPAAALTLGVIGTAVVHCLTAAKQRELHAGFELREQDVHDLTVLDGLEFDDWQVAPNIVGDAATYELENEALHRDGRLDRALNSIASWDNKTIIDIGCGAGFWLPHYARRAEHVIGIEPDRRLLELATQRTAGLSGVDVHHGSAAHLPIGDHIADVVHARFAYFFGSGSEAGLDEVSRILAPGGTFLAIDNSWSGGDFAQLLRTSTVGNATIDPDETRQWWADRGARRHEVVGAWSAKSNDELERILRIEFPVDVVSDFMQDHHRSTLSYRFAVYEWRSAEWR